MSDVTFMHQAIELARKGGGWVNPNPQVGCVIVREGRVIGQGWHERYGGAHAERNALTSCAEDPRGATLYVTLEPCCHTGHQPPCTQAIIEAGIGRVVVGSADPNPLVSGRGTGLLREAGVRVDEGIARAACDKLNEVFFHYITTKTPFVTMKYAMTMDGKVATRTGASRWVTGESALRRVHADRSRYAAVMVGVGTVLADDPLLTCRMSGGHEPVRVVVDAHWRTPFDSRLVRTARLATRGLGESALLGRNAGGEGRPVAEGTSTDASPGPVVIATACSDPSRKEAYRRAGVHVLDVPGPDGKVDLPLLMAKLGELGIDSVILEGGPTLNAAALESGIVQRVQAYVAPKMFGGSGAPSPVMGAGVSDPAYAVLLGSPTVRRFGDDFLIESDVLGPRDSDAPGRASAGEGGGR